MKRILIVDDEPEQLRSFRVGLKTRGYETMEALSAQAALQRLHEHRDRVALVLTDYAMPGMDGLSLLREIRSGSAALPVIVMSAHGSESLVRELVHSGCDAFMEKPFTLDELIEEIKHIGSRRGLDWEHDTLEPASLHSRSPTGPDSGKPVVWQQAAKTKELF